MRPRLDLALGCAAALVLPTQAGAADAVRPVPENAISVSVLALSSGSLAVQYERALTPTRWSFATSLGVRHSGGRDFDVLETAFGVEGRFWFSGRAPFSTFARRAMVGPHLGFRVDYGIVRVSDDRHILGATHTVAEAVMFGYRFAFAGVVELTPSVGVGLRTELDPTGRLAPWTRGEIFRLGLTAGVLFLRGPRWIENRRQATGDRQQETGNGQLEVGKRRPDRQLRRRALRALRSSDCPLPVACCRSPVPSSFPLAGNDTLLAASASTKAAHVVDRAPASDGRCPRVEARRRFT